MYWIFPSLFYFDQCLRLRSEICKRMSKNRWMLILSYRFFTIHALNLAVSFSHATNINIYVKSISSAISHINMAGWGSNLMQIEWSLSHWNFLFNKAVMVSMDFELGKCILHINALRSFKKELLLLKEICIHIKIE